MNRPARIQSTTRAAAPSSAIGRASWLSWVLNQMPIPTPVAVIRAATVRARRLEAGCWWDRGRRHRAVCCPARLASRDVTDTGASTPGWVAIRLARCCRSCIVIMSGDAGLAARLRWSWAFRRATLLAVSSRSGLGRDDRLQRVDKLSMVPGNRVPGYFHGVVKRPGVGACWLSACRRCAAGAGDTACVAGRCVGCEREPRC